MSKPHLLPEMAVASIIGIGALHGDSAPMLPPSPEAIATSQYSCNITDVVDTGRTVYRHGTMRSSVVIALALTDNPEITDYTRLHPRGHADHMRWSTPTAAVFGADSRGRRATDAADFSIMDIAAGYFKDEASPTGDNHHPSFTAYPRKEHPVGKQADVYLKTEVLPAPDRNRINKVTGYVLCGTIEKQPGGKWTEQTAEYKFVKAPTND